MHTLSRKAQKRLIIFSFLLIPLLLLATFSFYPAFKLIFLSFTSWDGLSQSYPFVGLHNYKIIFTTSAFWGVFIHNFSYLIGGIIQNVIAIVFAILLNSAIRARNFWRMILFIPYVLNSVAIAYMFKFVFQDTGALNLLLAHIGLAHHVSWLGNPHLVNWSLAFVSLWKYMPFNMVIYLAALQSIDPALYEASTMDGASIWQQFRFVTLPNLRAIIQVNMLLTVSGALEVFDIPFAMLNGSPDVATYVTKSVDTAFVFDNYGLASAMGVVLIILVIVVISVQRKLIGQGDDVV